MNGDYYIEFNPVNPTVVNIARRDFDFFDITVQNTISNTEIIGRLWSKNWDMTTNALANPFVADLYVYTKDSIVTKVKFNGIKPFGFVVSCNYTGCTNTGNPAQDRKSQCGRVNYPEFKIFLNDPDITVYPTGVIGGFTNSPTFKWCSQGSYYCLNISVNKPGHAEVLIDLNGIIGFQAGTSDVLILANVLAGSNCFQWDGKNGFGVTVPIGSAISIRVDYKFGLTNFPFFDAETHSNGFIVNDVRPTIPGNPALFWDDSNLGGCVGLGAGPAGTTNLTGCQPVIPSGCHSWTTNFGNDRTVNTWWYISSSIDFATVILPGTSVTAGPDISV